MSITIVHLNSICSLTGFYEWFQFKNDTTSGSARFCCSLFARELTTIHHAYLIDFFSEPAYYYHFADAAMVMIDAANLPEEQEYISVKDFSAILVAKGYSLDR